MTTAYEWIGSASSWWWPRFADHLWQTTLVALVILGALLLLRRGAGSNAQWRHTFCLLASAKFILPAALFVLLAERAGIESLLPAAQSVDQNALISGITDPVATLASTYEVTVVGSTVNDSENFYVALTSIWFAGTILILSFRAVRRRRLVRSLRLGKSLDRGREWDVLQKARGTLRMTRHVELLVSPLQIEPGVWRVWRPVIILPESMATLLDDDELEAIMLHEVIHIQRRDHLIGQLQLALCALLWFHPLVWFISRRLFDEREQVCDQRVLELCAAPEAYASSILKVVRFCFGWRVAGVVGAASGTNLRRRIENIMLHGNELNTGAGSRLLAATLVGLGFLFVVGVSFYSRPYITNAAVTASALEQPSTSISEPSTTSIIQTSDKKSTKPKVTPPLPPTPPSAPETAEPVVATPPAPPAAIAPPAIPSEITSTPATPQTPPAQPGQPAQPAQPMQPPTPATKKEKAEKQNKDKSEKEKEKEKTKGTKLKIN